MLFFRRNSPPSYTNWCLVCPRLGWGWVLSVSHLTRTELCIVHSSRCSMWDKALRGRLGPSAEYESSHPGYPNSHRSLITVSGCPFRINTFLLWVFTHLDVTLMLSLLVPIIRLHSEMTWLKAAKKLRVQMFCLACCSNSLTTWRKLYPWGLQRVFERYRYLQSLC